MVQESREQDLREMAWGLGQQRRRPTVNSVFYKLVKSLSMILAALLAPLAFLTKKPVVVAFIGVALVVLESLLLIFRFEEEMYRERWQITNRNR